MDVDVPKVAAGVVAAIAPGGNLTPPTGGGWYDSLVLMVALAVAGTLSGVNLWRWWWKGHQFKREDSVALERLLKELERLKEDHDGQERFYEEQLRFEREKGDRERARADGLNEKLNEMIVRDRDIHSTNREMLVRLEHLTEQHEKLFTAHEALTVRHQDLTERYQALVEEHSRITSRLEVLLAGSEQTGIKP